MSHVSIITNQTYDNILTAHDQQTTLGGVREFVLEKYKGRERTKSKRKRQREREKWEVWGGGEDN